MKTQIIDNTLCVHPSISLWSGRSRLRPEDLGEDASKLPPSDLASLGSLKLCDPEILKKLNSQKRALERELLKFSVRFMGGFATTLANTNKAIRLLEEHKVKFQKLKKNFLDSLGSDIETWISGHSEWGSIIRERLPDVVYVDNRLSYSYQVFRIRTATDDIQAGSSEGLICSLSGLSGQLYREIAIEAKTIMDSLSSKDTVTQKIKRPFLTIASKLDQLSYLDSGAVTLSRYIHVVINGLPKAGKMTGIHLSNLILLTELLSDPDRMSSHGRKMLSATSNTVDDGSVPISLPEPKSEPKDILLDVGTVNLPESNVISNDVAVHSNLQSSGYAEEHHHLGEVSKLQPTRPTLF